MKGRLQPSAGRTHGHWLFPHSESPHLQYLFWIYPTFEISMTAKNELEIWVRDQYRLSYCDKAGRQCTPFESVAFKKRLRKLRAGDSNAIKKAVHM